ncbi:MAG: hypothetical protein JO042_07080, partial [Sinobacteraceae bacterium]|nr:hypothetical protein [Nevskiaceae bacterium]
MQNSSIKNWLIRLSVAGTSLYPLLACGLGLSDIQLESRLNQPLRARIEILDVTDEEWRQIHTRLNRESSPDMSALHPELLDGITLRVIEDGSHRHFVEVRSTAAVTEPLFDLPVEIAGPAGRVVRSYSVLLDPPAQGDDARLVQEAQRSTEPQRSAERQRATEPQRATDPRVGLKPTSGLQQTTAPHSNSNTHRRHKHHRRGSAHRSTAPARGAPAEIATPAHAAPTQQPQPLPAGNEHAQTELAQQLGALQQMLAKMQETIAAQNAQIVDLTAKIAARSQPEPTYAPRRSALTSQASPEPAQSPQATDTETDDADSTAPESRLHPYLWPIALGLTTTLALVAAVLLWRRAKRTAAEKHAEALWQTQRGQSLNGQAPAENDSSYRTRTVKSSPAT